MIRTSRGHPGSTRAARPHEWQVRSMRNSPPSHVTQRPGGRQCVRGRWLRKTNSRKFTSPAQVHRDKEASARRPGNAQLCVRVHRVEGGGRGRFGLGQTRNSSPPEPRPSARPGGYKATNVRSGRSPHSHGARTHAHLPRMASCPLRSAMRQSPHFRMQPNRRAFYIPVFTNHSKFMLRGSRGAHESEATHCNSRI